MFLIISIIFILIVTEIGYFSYFRNEFLVDDFDGDFIVAKVYSILTSIFLWVFFILTPYLLSEENNFNLIRLYEIEFGTIIGIVLFFYINWIITKKLNNKKNENKEHR